MRNTYRRNFADNGRADIDSDGQLGLRGPSGRICTRHTANHSSISSTTANVSFFSPRSQIQPSLLPSVSLFRPRPSHLSTVVALLFSELFFHESFAGSRLWRRGEKSKGKKKRKRDSYGRESPYATHIPRLEYIGDDNATIAMEKDTRMLCVEEDDGIKKRKIL